jgi:hypothetical protein
MYSKNLSITDTCGGTVSVISRLCQVWTSGGAYDTACGTSCMMGNLTEHMWPILME